MAWVWLGAGFAMIAVTAGLVGGGSRAPAASAPGTAAVASGAPAIPARRGRELPAVQAAVAAQGTGKNPIAGHLGPAGAPVNLEGTVIGIASGKPIVQGNGQCFMIVRGNRDADEVKRGALLHVAGTILGRSTDGMLYVAVKPR